MKRKTREEVAIDIEQNHNTSWIKEIINRNINRMDYIAITYRGLKITYKEMFENIKKYTLALRQNGLKHGDTFVVSLENSPEFLYFLGATSAIGAKIKVVSPDFDKDYLSELIGSANHDTVFISDTRFSQMSDVLKQSNKKVVIVPFEHSLKNGNPYEEITSKYFKLDKEQFNTSVQTYGGVLENLDSFISNGENYNGPVFDEVDMNEPFTITFSSGSTNSTRPKAIVHNSKSYIYMGRYHDQDVSNYPTMKKAVTLACIPTHSNTVISNAISDSLMEGGTVAFEPIYNEDYFLDSLIINKPTLALGTRSHWLCAMKKYYSDNSYENVRFPFMLVPTSVGEPLAPNEEKALNKWLRKTRTGRDYIPAPTSFVTMSVGGGDCEHGGIFFVLFRALQSKKPRKNMYEPIGMSVYNMVDIKALRPDGTYCEPYELGELVCVSPCNMISYENNDSANRDFFITDAYGKKWTKLSTYGYTDGKDRVYVKGRMLPNRKEIIPEFQVADVILKDTKNILSCEVVIVPEGNQFFYVAHIEPMLEKRLSNDTILKSAYERCCKAFGKEFADRMSFRLRTNDEGYPLTHCGKRSNLKLISEGLDNSICFGEKNLVEVDKKRA